MFSELPLADYGWWRQLGLCYPVVWVSAVFVAFALGACLGSFLNVCIWRIPRGESVVTAPSHCTSCGTEIRWFDNLPVISYIVLRGRCRACHAPYSCRYMVIEALTGLLFVAILFKVAFAQQVPAVLAPYWWAVLLSVSCAWIDAEHRIIPDALTFPALLFGIAVHGIFPSICGLKSIAGGLLYAVVSAAGPGLFLALFAFLGNKIARRDVLGWGDVKFVAACGALLGIPGALFVLLAGSFSGMVFGVILSLKRHRPLSRCAIAFGPFLAAGAVVWTLCGNWVWHWYLVLAGK